MDKISKLYKIAKKAQMNQINGTNKKNKNKKNKLSKVERFSINRIDVLNFKYSLNFFLMEINYRLRFFGHALSKAVLLEVKPMLKLFFYI